MVKFIPDLNMSQYERLLFSRGKYQPASEQITRATVAESRFGLRQVRILGEDSGESAEELERELTHLHWLAAWRYHFRGQIPRLWGENWQVMEQDINYANNLGEQLSPALITAAITSPFTAPIFTAANGQKFRVIEWATILVRPDLERNEKNYLLNLQTGGRFIPKVMVTGAGFLCKLGNQSFAFLENPDVPPLICDYPPGWKYGSIIHTQ